MRLFFSTVILLLVIAASQMPMAAQGIDSVWYFQWERSIQNNQGQKDPFITVRLWLSNTYSRMTINEDKYITISRDSIFVMDTMHSQYTSGPVSKMEQMWIKFVPFIRHRGIAPPMEILETGRTKSMLGYEAKELHVKNIITNKKFIPFQQRIFVTDEHPVADSLLPMLYRAFAIVDSDISIDLAYLADSLAARGVVPLVIGFRSQMPGDTTGTILTEMVDLRRVAVRDDYFLPPKTYTYNPLTLPSDDEIWMMRAIPMPGGPRDSSRQKR